jgi:hypothetical protein
VRNDYIARAVEVQPVIEGRPTVLFASHVSVDGNRQISQAGGWLASVEPSGSIRLMGMQAALLEYAARSSATSTVVTVEQAELVLMRGSRGDRLEPAYRFRTSGGQEFVVPGRSDEPI